MIKVILLTLSLMICLQAYSQEMEDFLGNWVIDKNHLLNEAECPYSIRIGKYESLETFHINYGIYSKFTQFTPGKNIIMDCGNIGVYESPTCEGSSFGWQYRTESEINGKSLNLKRLAKAKNVISTSESFEWEYSLNLTLKINGGLAVKEEYNENPQVIKKRTCHYKRTN